MDQFTRDNTEGYDAADLAALNAAWHAMPISDAEWIDHEAVQRVCEELLYHYDQGLRGEALILACT